MGFFSKKRVFVVLVEYGKEDTALVGVYGSYSKALAYTIDNAQPGVEFFIEEQDVL